MKQASNLETRASGKSLESNESNKNKETFDTNKHETKQLKENIQAAQLEKEYTNAMNFAHTIDSHEIMPDPESIQQSINKILAKCLDAHQGLQEKFIGTDITQRQETLTDKHPELLKTLIFDLNINNFSSKSYDALTPQEKIKILAIDGAINDMLPLAIGLQDKQGNYNYDKIQQRYRQKIDQRMQNILSTFRRDQRLTFSSIETVLQEEYNFSEVEANEFKKYLDSVQEKMEAMQPEESGIGYGYIYLAGIITGVLMSGLGFMTYKYLTSDQGKDTIKLDNIILGDAKQVAKLISAEQKFSIQGEKTKELYDSENSMNSITSIGKQAINYFQSRTVALELTGKLNAYFDFDKEHQYSYNPNTKMLEITLPNPEIMVSDQQHSVLERTDETFQIKEFDNLESELVSELKEKAINEGNHRELLQNSMGKMADFMLSVIKPTLESTHPIEIQGIKITVQQPDNTSPLEQTYKDFKG